VELSALLEELQDLVELHERNNLNLCLAGGMNEVLGLALGHPSEKVRNASCFLVSSVCANNKKVQEFASRSGAINLVNQFHKETNIRNKEAVFGALSSFIRSENFDGKRRFIQDFNGLDFLASLLNDDMAKVSLKLYKKVLLLTNDLVTNDDYIVKNNPFAVREYFVHSQHLTKQLLNNISTQMYAGDLGEFKMVDVRQQTLRILFRLHQYSEEFGEEVLPILHRHKEHLVEVIKAAGQADLSLLKEELELTDKAIEAPTLPWVKNYSDSPGLRPGQQVKEEDEPMQNEQKYEEAKTGFDPTKFI